MLHVAAVHNVKGYRLYLLVVVVVVASLHELKAAHCDMKLVTVGLAHTVDVAYLDSVDVAYTANLQLEEAAAVTAAGSLKIIDELAGG